MFPGNFVATTPDKPAIVRAATGESLTYRQLDENSVRLAKYLRAAGLEPGDHIALISDNDLRVMEVYWAALRSGLYLTVVNWHLTPSEAAYVVNDCGAKVLVASAGAAASDCSAGAAACSAGADFCAGAGFWAGAASAAAFSCSPYSFLKRISTGSSTVEEADLTNSPISLSLSRTNLLSTPYSLASS